MLSSFPSFKSSVFLFLLTLSILLSFPSAKENSSTGLCKTTDLITIFIKYKLSNRGLSEMLSRKIKTTPGSVRHVSTKTAIGRRLKFNYKIPLNNHTYRATTAVIKQHLSIVIMCVMSIDAQFIMVCNIYM